MKFHRQHKRLKMDVIGNNMEKKRIEYIDLMKGICILTVVALHFKIFPEESSLNYIQGAISIPLYFLCLASFIRHTRAL